MPPESRDFCSCVNQDQRVFYRELPIRARSEDWPERICLEEEREEKRSFPSCQTESLFISLMRDFSGFI